jgi:glutamate-ammonia-ligase adenylyltransferase
MQFKSIMAYVSGKHTVKQSNIILTELAQYILSLVIQQAWKQTQSKIDSPIAADDLIVVAYGSLAMKNMHLQSDFDIVFILNKDITDDNYKFVMRWIKRIIHLLSIKTFVGSLYKLDTQLRPNRHSGAAIVSLSNFEHYQLDQAWLWEHAALIKSRTVYATLDQNHWFEKLRKKVLCQKRDPQIVDNDLAEMAIKLKLQSNKMHQNEFNILGDILKQAHTNPKIINHIQTNDKYNKLKLDNSIHNS